ncbi:MAG: TIGR00341 family protein [Synechococcus sp. NAT40]|nr:TIGR00341 family protein [Synechococcus sp. NAT40]|tara:strand:+ start:850 stop:1965 length:1116 start_codon:yes stop_codon:yes gene_type:complete
MGTLLRRALQNISGEWQLNLESRVPRDELYRARIASSKPSLGFFILLICSAVIATLGLIANSTAVVIGAMIVAPLMEPILSLAFGLTVSDDRLIKRSAITVIIGVATVVGTAWILAGLFGASEVNNEMTARTAPNLIDLVIAVAAAIAGAFTISRDRLSNSIAGVAIAVALVPPLCVCGIGLSLGSELTAVFGRGTITGLTNQVAEGSLLLFLANLIGITVASLAVFMLQRYGSVKTAWRHLLVWLGLLGLLCIPLSSSLHDFSVRQQINSQFSNFKAGLIQQGKYSGKDAYTLQRIKLLYSNVRVLDNSATIDIVLNVPEKLVGQIGLDEMQQRIRRQAQDEYGLEEVTINISVIPTQILRYNPTSSKAS